MTSIQAVLMLMSISKHLHVLSMIVVMEFVLLPEITMVTRVNVIRDMKVKQKIVCFNACISQYIKKGAKCWQLFLKLKF